MLPTKALDVFVIATWFGLTAALLEGASFMVAGNWDGWARNWG